jgi:CRP/FNR family transcriptional regulator
MLDLLTPARGEGPAIRALDPWTSSAGRMRQLLSRDERARLAALATVARHRKGEIIYRQGGPADAVFNVVTGAVAAFRTAPDGREHMVAFLLPEDIFGLSAERRYANSARALTPVTLYRLPVATLRTHLLRDPALEFHLICKLSQELRQSQRHALLLSQRRADAKLAMFLQLIEELQIARSEKRAEIFLPMHRSDIGEYLGMTLSAVSRAFAALTRRGIIALPNRSHVRIADRAAFERLIADPRAVRAAE